MRGTEILRLAWLNIFQNKFKTVMTSIGIVVGAATIVMMIAIGRGGQMDVAEQFSNLNAGAIDISYEWEGEEASGGGSGGFSFGAIGEFFSGGLGGMFGGSSRQGGGAEEGGFGGGAAGNFDGGDSGGDMQGGGRFSGGEMPGGGNQEGFGEDGMPGGGNQEGSGEDGMPGGGNREGSREDGMPGEGNEASEEAERASEGQSAGEDEAESENEESIVEDRMNQENIILSEEDAEDISTFVTGISGITISYTARSSVEGGDLTESQMYTVAGVKNSYAEVSKLSMAEGEFITEEDDSRKAKVCVLGSSIAKELFGDAEEACGSTLYIDDRAYIVNGVLKTTSTVSAGISPDEAIFIPYSTGIKYITGEDISPTITVLSEDTNAVDEVEEKISVVLSEKYNNAEFSFEDAGSKMEAAESSNRILTLLLSAMAAIVFVVGGIGIMNVLFVSVKERTNEIGILKALGASRTVILSEFLIESVVISLIGGILGVAVSFAATPIVEYYNVRVEANALAWISALGFAVLTGTLFGIYPAWKAAQMVPVEALNAE